MNEARHFRVSYWERWVHWNWFFYRFFSFSIERETKKQRLNSCEIYERKESCRGGTTCVVVVFRITGGRYTEALFNFRVKFGKWNFLWEIFGYGENQPYWRSDSLRITSADPWRFVWEVASILFNFTNMISNFVADLDISIKLSAKLIAVQAFIHRFMAIALFSNVFFFLRIEYENLGSSPFDDQVWRQKIFVWHKSESVFNLKNFWSFPFSLCKQPTIVYGPLQKFWSDDVSMVLARRVLNFAGHLARKIFVIKFPFDDAKLPATKSKKQLAAETEGINRLSNESLKVQRKYEHVISSTSTERHTFHGKVYKQTSVNWNV